MLLLTIIQGPDKGRRFELPDYEPQLIGRSSEALPLSDNTVSRRHAELTPDDGAWYVRDLESQNGTYINGVRIHERTRLRPGDQVRTGSTLLVFGATEQKEPDLVRFVGGDSFDAAIERTMSSNEDSVVLSEPEPQAAAVEHLRLLYSLSSLIAQAPDRQELLRKVMELVFDEFRPERGLIVAAEPSPQPGAAPLLKPAIVKHRTPPIDPGEAKISVSRTIMLHALRKGEGVLSTNAMGDPSFKSGDSVQRMNIRSAICAPIRFKDRTFGAIYIDSSIANYTFTVEQLALMNAIGRQTGLALANAELYAQKLQAERLAAIGETVASLSHSIKNILQGLRGGADVVEMGLKKDDLKISKGGWGILKRNLDRIINLTLNMLAFSRQRRVEVELTKLGPLIEDCAQLLEGLCATKGSALIVDVDTEMPPIPIDPSLMHQALMNLMGNAVEAVEPGVGAVTVGATYSPGPAGAQTGATVTITVRDNGPGIPPDKQAWIFEPFNTTKGLRGTGLGLAVAKRIVDEHRGTIRLESGKGSGTTFIISLPADAAIDPSATATTKPEIGPAQL